MATTVRAPAAYRSIWYMGAKSRVLPGFLDRVFEAELSDGDTVVDLMAGSGVVSAHCAGRYRVIANDVQAYSEVVTRALIEHSPADKEAFLTALSAGLDLTDVFARNFDALERRYGLDLAREDEFLGEFRDGGGPSWEARYRAYLERFATIFPGEPVPTSAGLAPGATTILSPREIDRRRRDPRVGPSCLATTYYANVYYGLRQAFELDSLRAAIDAIEPSQPWAAKLRAHWLAALIGVASVSTSGTSHFAQPRHLRKDSELRAMAKRRTIDVKQLFAEQAAAIAETISAIDHRPGNRVLQGDYRELLRAGGAFDFGDEVDDVDLVYLDPPYTADNYSRFYHALESIARYDYPELERGRDGAVLRGRYPLRSRRFRSDFCRAAAVEGEFRRVIEGCARIGAKLVISYSYPSGLLLKGYARSGVVDPVARFRALCRERYRCVDVERRTLLHSGQGDSNVEIDELLLVCSRP